MVEVFYQGSWGPVCGDDWGINEAQVICRELGLGTSKGIHEEVMVTGYSKDSHLKDVRCRGTESSLFDCFGSILGLYKCNSSRLAKVQCSQGGKKNAYISQCTEIQLYFYLCASLCKFFNIFEGFDGGIMYRRLHGTPSVLS